MPGLDQQQHLKNTQLQTAVLSARQQLGLNILSMPQLDLEAELQENLAKNPFLEEVMPENFNVEVPEDAVPRSDADSDDYEDGFEVSLARQEEWVNNLPLPESGDDRKLAFLSNSPAPGPTLRDVLLGEAENADIPERLKFPVLEIISSLDPNGFLTVPLVDLVMSCALSSPEDADIDISDLEEALEIVRQLAPPDIWIGRRSDFFKQQLENCGKLTPLFARLCDELEQLPDGVNGDELKKQFLPELAGKLQITFSELEAMLSVIKEFKLNSFAESGVPETGVVYPDLEITAGQDGDFTVNVLYENSRRITISTMYEKLCGDKSLSEKDQKFVSEKLSEAKNLIQALSMRESTLKRLGDLIVTRQKDFFLHGVSGLKSFTKSEAAELLGFNPSTITRAVDGKYARTPRGVLPLEFFFQSGGGSAAAGERSREAVMEDIRHIIDGENPALPLSDDRIAGMLKAKGISIERRTVAKYRTLLKIPGASKRKKW